MTADLARAGREDARPDPSELATAMLGDRGLLVPLSAWGEPQQLFWPHPDRDPNLAGFALRVGSADGAGTGVLLRELAAEQGVDRGVDQDAEQHVEDDADIVTTRLALDGTDAGLRIRAMIDPEGAAGTAALLLHVDLAEEVGPRRLTVDLAFALGGVGRDDASLVDPSGVLVGYRHDRVLALAVARDGELLACDVLPAGPQASTRDVRVEVPSGLASTLVLAFGRDRPAAVAAAQATARRGVDAVARARRAADAAASASRTPTSVDGRQDVLDRVGLRVLRALQDADGGVLAAPECDPGRRRSGGYGFVWARDLAFIMLAAAVAGQRDVVDGSLAWLVRAQSPDGLYEQRHWSDGRVAPTWGLQLDETGAVLHAVHAVARVLDDPSVVERCWLTVRSAADALSGLLDPHTGLPPASLDAWEERVGVHTYTVAATIAGLEAAAAMAEGRDGAAGERWSAAAARCREGLDALLWSPELGRFLRGRDVARDDDGGAPVPPRHQPPGRPGHPVRSVEPIDATVDASLLGLAYPFGVLAHDDPRLVATIDAVERELRAGPGLLRYPGDPYVGGNPWLLTRLWLGLARRAPGAADTAGGVEDVAACATAGLLLPEQVDVETGRPVWVVPLAWTHAFYALACRPDHRGDDRRGA